jgi:mannosyltransferase OCH1-like enzyme
MIPKIIHQLWIGSKPAPINLMNTWKEKHPEFEYIFWNEEEFVKRGMIFECQDKINEIEEINGKADILRWEILYKYGGIFIDADSICIEPIDNLLLLNKSFASYENELVRGAGWGKNNKDYDDVLANTHALVATGTMAFPANHQLVKMAIDWIKDNDVSTGKTGKRAWKTVGPGLLTRIFYSKKWDDIEILPSYYFLPFHYLGNKYEGHGKVYAYQEWGSTKKNYETMNDLELPIEFSKPVDSVSVLISSYDTKFIYIKECLESIKNQDGHFNIEIVWINDGSNSLNTILLEKTLQNFINNTRFISIKYHKNETNSGIGATLNNGINLCSNDIIMKMDSDDIMVRDRIKKQLNFMKNNPLIHICGGQILMFRDNINNIVNKTNHSSITWDNYKNSPSHWFINHPTVCYRKQSVINAGNYDKNLNQMAEDFELELRMLKHYKIIFNFEEPLLYYRLHSEQVTNKTTKEREYWEKIRNDIITNLIKN